MDRAKAVVYLCGLFAVATIGQAVGLAWMAGIRPQLSVFVLGGVAIGGIAGWTMYRGSYEEFELFRQHTLLFWGVVAGFAVYLGSIALQFL